MPPTITVIPQSEFQRVQTTQIDEWDKLQLIADMCRANTLASVKRAGSGHLGSSLSAMDIVVLLYYREMNTVAVGLDSSARDIYFSSKGHDAPGLYAILHSLGILGATELMSLRRFGGLDGHPDVRTPGAEANTGSLGMGISKGKGMAHAKTIRGDGGTVYVLTGDGELQEGQNYEAFGSAAQHHVDNMIVITDHNKLQSDKMLEEIISLGDMEGKLRAFGWLVERCDGHDMRAVAAALGRLRAAKGQPKILIADTIKGRGISFMEHPQALQDGGGLYRWHSGAPDDVSYERAYTEVIAGINARFGRAGLGTVAIDEVPPEQRPGGSVTREFVAEAYGQALVDLAPSHPNMVVLDGDLAADCRIRNFENIHPKQFIECGIAEQDMASTAGGLALSGMLPIVNSFASFLASRANEQIYTNATEGTKIIYACHYAGLIPAGPGNSHQSVRDISLFGALPNCIILQPANSAEARQAVEYCVDTATDNCMLRLVIGPSPRTITLPEDYALTFGKGVTLMEGGDAVLFAYGPVMLNEALVAGELLAQEGFKLRVVNMPWLNRVDKDWLNSMVRDMHHVFVQEDHSVVGGLGDCLLNAMAEEGLMDGRRLAKFGLEEYPEWGTPWEVLAHHKLDGASVAARIKMAIGL